MKMGHACIEDTHLMKMGHACIEDKRLRIRVFLY